MISDLIARLPLVARIRRAISPPAVDTLTEYAVFVNGARVSEFCASVESALGYKQSLPPTQRAAALILDDLGRCIVR